MPETKAPAFTYEELQVARLFAAGNDVIAIAAAVEGSRVGVRSVLNRFKSMTGAKTPRDVKNYLAAHGLQYSDQTSGPAAGWHVLTELAAT